MPEEAPVITAVGRSVISGIVAARDAILGRMNARSSVVAVAIACPSARALPRTEVRLTPGDDTEASVGAVGNIFTARWKP
jgi:hypothetical protein